MPGLAWPTTRSRLVGVEYVIVISLSTVEYTSVSRVYSTVDSGITNLIQDRLCALKREEVRRQGQSD